MTDPFDYSSLKPGQSFQISDFDGDAMILERMHEMGLRLGLTMQYIRRAPFGGPFLFQVATTLLALRSEELACLKLTKQ